MSFTVTADEMVRTFGLSSVVYFPRHNTTESTVDPRTADFLSGVGLPDDDVFMSRASVGVDGGSSRLPERFGPEDGQLPQECQSWLVLGYFCHSLLALDPGSGKVYAFGEGVALEDYIQLHRDVESLAYALTVFKKHDQLASDGNDRTQRVEEVRALIAAFDELPFDDEDSQWNMIFDEVLSDIW